MERLWTALVKPLLECTKPKVIVEVGCGEGKLTRHLLNYCIENDAFIHAVDPNPADVIDRWQMEYPEYIRLHRGLSLNVLGRINRVDVVFLDGDPNWYTVYNELRLLYKTSQSNNATFPLVIASNVSWPYGRRDMYHDPDTIPAAFLKPHAKKGLIPTSLEPVEKGGLNQQRYNALYENNLQNGVLTAIEDFIGDVSGKLRFVSLPVFHGVGLLMAPEITQRSAALDELINSLGTSDLMYQIIREVELDRIQGEVRLAELSQALADRNHKVDELRRQLLDKEATVESLRQALADANAALSARLKETSLMAARIRSLEAQLAAVFASHSWKITKPMRVAGDLVKPPLRKVLSRLPVLALRKSGTSRASRQTKPVKETGDAGKDVPGGGSSALCRLGVSDGIAASDPNLVHRQLTVAIIAWDVGHNPLGRAYLLAEALSRYFRVILLGPAFKRFGGRVWEPLESSDIPVIPLPGADFPEFARNLEVAAERLAADVVIACKPRLPSLLLGHLAKLKRNRPLFVDIDDLELAFTKGDARIGLDQVERGTEADRRAPHSDLWTEYAENLLEGIDGIFVSNRELKSRFGGLEVPHARDERVFDPSLYDRDLIRTRLGLARDDRVVLFAGTPRAHKGVLQVLRAVASIPDPRAKMLIVGQPDRNTELQLRRIGGDRLILLGNRPFEELPEYLACADAVCLLQDPTSRIAQFQLPAKVVDALAFGLPVLATPVAPLRPLIDAGVVFATNGDSLGEDLQRVLFESETADARCKRRQYFLQYLSYAAVGKIMARAILEAVQQPVKPVNTALEVLRVAKTVRPERTQSAIETPPNDGLDLVFVWKQRDMFLYGRRPEMLVKYLALRPDVRRIVILEPPVSVDELNSWAKADVTHQNRAMYVEWMRKSLGVYDSDKIRCHTFTYATRRQVGPYGVWRWPVRDDYLDSVAEFLARNGVDPSKATFIVYPKNEWIPKIVARFSPRRVIADVVDDHRTWPGLSEREKQYLTSHYRQVLRLSEFVITNCEPVQTAMSVFHPDVRVLPNGIDLQVDESYPTGRRFRECFSLPRPWIGYVGNLDKRIDVGLLRRVAEMRPQWQFILVGSVHANPEVLELGLLPNIHVVGVVPAEEAKHWIRKFDVCIIPHRRMALTGHMNPLKFYQYLGLGAAIVSTPVDNLGDLAKYATFGSDAESFVAAIEHQLAAKRNSIDPALQRDIEKNLWSQRATTLMEWLAN